jgi:3-deoxy-D-manno-octulosonic-acid transferase
MALFDAKAKDFLSGRRQTFKKLEVFRNSIPNANLIWVHCASLGEFEQGRPVIEGIKSRWPEKKILLTFFSPSGYTIRKDYEYADFVSYMPLDTKSNANRFIQLVRPDLAIFVKYEFWYNHLSVLKENQIPHILVSAIFRPRQVFFKWYGGLFRKILSNFQHLFVQDKASLELMQGLKMQHSSLVGDTRVDRVAQIAKTAKPFPLIKSFVSNNKVFVAGSSWPPGEDILCPFFNDNLPKDWKVIIAPHEITPGQLKGLESRLSLKSIRYSQLTQNQETDARVLIIDNIGMLASLYKYGTLTYIGGGFGSGIHNILEPATFGLPIIFGPKYEKFKEAVALKNKGGAFPIENEKELSEVFEFLLIEENYKKAASASKAFIENNTGATESILNFLAGL